MLLRRDPSLIADLAHDLLDAHFAESLHEDLLAAVGLDLTRLGVSAQRLKRKRDPAFRESVLRAYSYQCAVCGFDARVGYTLVGIEAAHVQWHQAGGPDAVQNGLALCALHHRLLDRGAWTLSTDRTVRVAEAAHGGEAFKRWVLAYHGCIVAAPVADEHCVAERHLEWHHREVFRPPARPLR